MKEFIFYSWIEKNARKSLTSEEHHEFIEKCETYIGSLKSENKLIAVQPIISEE